MSASSPAHTPGPWRVTGYSTIEGVRKGRCVTICDPFSATEENDGTKPIPIDEREANARLIAAAPEMHAALKEAEADIVWLMETMGNQDRSTTSLVRIRAAIARAEGRAS